MIMLGRCYWRNCKHYQGFSGPKPPASDRDDEDGQVGAEACPPYPNGIPYSIAYGDNLHLTVQPDQEGTLVYEKGTGKPRE